MPNWFLTKKKEESFQQMVLEQLDIHMQKKKKKLLPMLYSVIQN